MGASQGTMNNFHLRQRQLPVYETICGGSGAGDGFDGTDAVHTHMTNTRLTDPEVLEWRFPVLLESFRIRHGSGGEGKWRGGKRHRAAGALLEAMTAAILSGHRRISALWHGGGAPGKVGRNWVERADGSTLRLGGADKAELVPGEVFVQNRRVHRFPGRGIWYAGNVSPVPRDSGSGREVCLSGSLQIFY